MANNVIFKLLNFRENCNNLKVSGVDTGDLSDGISVISDGDDSETDNQSNAHSPPIQSIADTPHISDEGTVTKFENISMLRLEKDESSLLEPSVKWISSNILIISFFIGFVTIAFANYLRLNATDQSNEHNSLLAQRVQTLELENEALKIIVNRLILKQENHDNWHQNEAYMTQKSPNQKEPPTEQTIYNTKKFAKKVWTGDGDGEEPIYLAPKESKNKNQFNDHAADDSEKSAGKNYHDATVQEKFVRKSKTEDWAKRVNVESEKIYDNMEKNVRNEFKRHKESEEKNTSQESGQTYNKNKERKQKESDKNWYLKRGNERQKERNADKKQRSKTYPKEKIIYQ